MKELRARQSNTLIMATHEMGVNQMKTFLYICSHYNGSHKLELSFNDMNNVLNPNRGTSQKEILISTISGMMRSAFIRLNIDKNDDYCEAPVFILARKKADEDTMSFVFNPYIVKELEKARGYTWLYLKQITGMNSFYAIRLYEFFAMRLGSQNKEGTFNFTVKKLREYLDCTEKYKAFTDFEKRIIKIANKQINEKTNIHMKYKKIKKGSSVTNIVFTFKWKNKEDAINVYKEDYIEPSQEPGEEAQVEPSTIEEDETMEEGKAVIDQLLKEIRESKEKVNHNKVIKR